MYLDEFFVYAYGTKKKHDVKIGTQRFSRNMDVLMQIENSRLDFN